MRGESLMKKSSGPGRNKRAALCIKLSNSTELIVTHSGCQVPRSYSDSSDKTDDSFLFRCHQVSSPFYLLCSFKDRRDELYSRILPVFSGSKNSRRIWRAWRDPMTLLPLVCIPHAQAQTQAKTPTHEPKGSLRMDALSKNTSFTARHTRALVAVWLEVATTLRKNPAVTLSCTCWLCRGAVHLRTALKLCPNNTRTR